MGLAEDLGPGPAAVDACVLIYFFERHRVYGPLLRPVFEQAGRGERALYTSALSLLEVGVGPLRAHNLKLWDAYRAVLTRNREVRLVPIHRRQLELATRIRAATSLKTPDALQMAAAMASGCGCLLTNDLELRAPSFSRVRVLQLADYAGAGGGS